MKTVFLLITTNNSTNIPSTIFPSIIFPQLHGRIFSSFPECVSIVGTVSIILKTSYAAVCAVIRIATFCPVCERPGAWGTEREN